MHPNERDEILAAFDGMVYRGQPVREAIEAGKVTLPEMVSKLVKALADEQESHQRSVEYLTDLNKPRRKRHGFLGCLFGAN